MNKIADGEIDDIAKENTKIGMGEHSNFIEGLLHARAYYENFNYKFPFIHVCKYAKNHYQPTDSIWYDIGLCLLKDAGIQVFGYNENKTPQEECFYERRHIVNIIIKRILPLIKEFRGEELLKHASPEDCWKIGYYTKGNTIHKRANEQLLPEYDYWEAILRAYLAELRFLTYTDLGYDNINFLDVEKIPELIKKEVETTEI